MPPKKDKKGFAVLFLQPHRVAWTLMTFVLKDWGNRADKNCEFRRRSKNGLLFSGNRCVRAETMKVFFLRSKFGYYIYSIQQRIKMVGGAPQKNLLLGIAISLTQNSNFPRNPWRIHFSLFLCVGKKEKLPLSIFAQKGILQVDTAEAKAKSSPFTLPPLVCSST